MMRGRRAFSLVELMVVIGIIAILLAIILPAMGVAREHAKAIECQSQLRQIGYALHQYAIANSGHTPTWIVHHEWLQKKLGMDNSPGWPALIERFLGQGPDGRIWNCPSWPEPDRCINYFLGTRWMHVQTPLLRSMPITKIRNSTTFIFVGECTAAALYDPPFGTGTEADGNEVEKNDGCNSRKCLLFFGDEGGMNFHRRGNNVLFADNHVAAFKKFDPDALTYSPLSRATWEDVTAEQ